MAYANKTKVPVDRSRAEVERLIHRHGCTKYGSAVDYETGKVRLQFNAQSRIIRIEMDMPKGEQATRAKWRALVLVLKAKLEAVESKISTFEEEFMPFIVLPDDRTVGQHMKPAIASMYSTGKMPAGYLGAGEAK